jgi:hypothetical protein
LISLICSPYVEIADSAAGRTHPNTSACITADQLPR